MKKPFFKMFLKVVSTLLSKNILSHKEFLPSDWLERFGESLANEHAVQSFSLTSHETSC